MRLKCIKKGDGFITFGKFYTVAIFDDNNYVTIDDIDSTYIVPISYFENIQKMRNEKLKELGI